MSVRHAPGAGAESLLASLSIRTLNSSWLVYWGGHEVRVRHLKEVSIANGVRQVHCRFRQAALSKVSRTPIQNDRTIERNAINVPGVLPATLFGRICRVKQGIW
jgi:hypothetical protein